MSQTVPTANTVHVPPSAEALSAPVAANPRKRQRIDEETESVAATTVSQHADMGERRQEDAMSTAPTTRPSEEIPAAMRIIRALQYADRVRQIGTCPTKHAAQTKMMLGYGPRSDDKRSKIVEESQYDSRTAPPEKRAKDAAIARNQERFEELAKIAKESGQNRASDYLRQPFRLRVTRPGCEFDGLVTAIPPPPPEVKKKLPSRNWLDEETDEEELAQEKKRKEEDRARGAALKARQAELKVRLPRWYKNAATSGYGDVREQVTKVDKSVRTAREIGPSEFEVEDELLRRIEAIWTERFVPSADVRAEPYKIHLYGPGGHFKLHRDTPQKDLVGTFLVGLGDTASAGGLVVDGTKMDAHPGVWCAFYPDVPHYVKELYGGYRAVIAFKIFRAPTPTGMAGENNETTKTAEVRRQVAEIIAQMEAPYGILLEHKYSLGTDEFSGFDSLLADAVRTQSAGRFAVHHLPVVVQSWSTWGSHSSADPYEDFTIRCSTRVYPFTSGHIDALNVFGSDQYGIEHGLCGCPWLDGVEDVPFYTVDLSKRTMLPVKEDESETCNYVGNEAQAWRDDSVYLSYALLALPRAARGEGDQDREGAASGSQ